MKGLFWRVFAWYLSATVVVLGLGFGYSMLINPENRFQRAVSVSQDAIQSQGESAIAIWRDGGPDALRTAFAKANRPRFLFDSEERELSGRDRLPNIRKLVTRTLSSRVIELEILPPDTYAALKLNSRGKDFVYARVLAAEGGLGSRPRPLPLWARLGLGLFTASLICFLFAQYVTSPLTQLRSATREFASGNLEVRIGSAKPFNRGDEFTDLAHDFDDMATQLQNLVLAQQRLLGDISHELRSPLARLQLALEIARRKAGDDAEPSLNRIEQEAERLNTLIGQILRATRAELNPSAKKLFDLSNLVREVAEDADFEAAGKDRRVLIDGNDISLVHGDRELLRSAIENVVRNAIRYTPGKTEVTIDLKRREPAHAVVTVRDHGPGVPAGSLTHLFEPFYRVHDARDRDSGGAGLGLAITRHAVLAHGGKVSATNCEGGGFEVQIDLPLKVPELAQLYLGRLMAHPQGLASDPAFAGLLDVGGPLSWDSNSQGSIFGGTTTALAPDWRRAVLGVATMDYATLLQRSTDFSTYKLILNPAYPDPTTQTELLSLIEMLWDRTDSDGWTQHMTARPPARTPAHTILMHVAVGDHQVANVMSDVEARSIGASIQRPSVAPDRTHDRTPSYAIPTIPRFPFFGSAVVWWDGGPQTPLEPTTNTAPTTGADPHSFPRSTRAAREQKAAFLLGKGVVDVCGGQPCRTDNYG